MVLLLSTGIVSFKKQDYQCLDGRSVMWGEKVELFNYGVLRINGFPVKYDCIADEQYDPKLLEVCGQELCRKDNIN